MLKKFHTGKIDFNRTVLTFCLGYASDFSTFAEVLVCWNTLLLQHHFFVCFLVDQWSQFFFSPATWFCTVLFQRHISLAVNLKCFKKFVTAASDERRSHWLWGLCSQELHWLKTSKILLFSNKCHVTGAAGVGAFWFKISTHQIVSVLQYFGWSL